MADMKPRKQIPRILALNTARVNECGTVRIRTPAGSDDAARMGEMRPSGRN